MEKELRYQMIRHRTIRWRATDGLSIESKAVNAFQLRFHIDSELTEEVAEYLGQSGLPRWDTTPFADTFRKAVVTIKRIFEGMDVEILKTRSIASLLREEMAVQQTLDMNSVIPEVVMTIGQGDPTVFEHAMSVLQWLPDQGQLFMHHF